jgi:predicted amidohydrolase YtcJ
VKTLYRSGAVYSPADPFATALLVDGATVAWVGTDEAADALASEALNRADGDRLVELNGALVTPAFVDAHVHVTETGLALDGVDVSDARSVAEILDRVEAASRRSRGRPVLGHGWDERRLAEGRPPTRAELDRAAVGGVVYLSRVDVHSAVISSALAAASGASGLGGWHPDGRVEREAHHAARHATRDHLTGQARRTAQHRALSAAAASGIAAVHEMGAVHVGPAHDLEALVALVREAEQNQEPLPEVVPFWAEQVVDEAGARAVLQRFQDVGVRLAGLGGDLNVDGSLGSRTAALRDPYTDDAGRRGHLYLSADDVAAQVVGCSLAGVRTGFHVIGDAAVDTVLAGFDRAVEAIGIAAVMRPGHRLEHAEALDAVAVSRISGLGLTLSLQPAFDAAWGGEAGMYAERLGPARAAGLNPFGPIAAAGIAITFGSDAPVTPFDPWGAVRAAAFPREAGHAISARAGFGAHTRGAWRAVGQPDRGVLRPGAEATLAIWSATELVVQAPDVRLRTWSTDPRAGTPALPDVSPGVELPRCLLTTARGRTLFDAGELSVVRP